MIKSKKILKTGIAFALAAVMVLAFCACGGSESSEEEQTGGEGAENPIIQVDSAEELCKATDIEIDAPEGAENVSYSYIKGSEDEENLTGQVVFTVDGVEYTYRARATGMINLDEYLKGTDYEGEDIAKAMMEGAEVGTDLSGMYGEWKAAALVTVSGRDGLIALNEGKEGVLIWIDQVPGVMYSLSVSDGAEQDAMMDVAEKTFVPLQGDVDGDEE